MSRPVKFNRLLTSDLTLIVREWELRGRPRQDGVDWPLQEWLNDFPEYEAFFRQLKSKNLGLLSRKLVKEVTLSSVLAGKLELGFLACMIWGFGDRGYAQHRTRKIMSAPNFMQILADTVDNLRKGDIAAAYTSLIENGPDGLGCSFGTKYLYFASPEDEKLKPIIVDALIAKAINEWTRSRVNPLKMDANQYVKLIEEFSQASQALGLPSEVLEEILFSEMAKKSGSSSWNSSIPLTLSEREKKSWVLSLIVDMIRKGALINVERTHPGGGQYDCIGLKTHHDFEVQFNVNGSIHIFKPAPSHLDWEAAFQLGVLEVSRRLRNAEANQERAMPSHLSDSFSWLSRALIGKAEIDVQDFESFFILNDDQKAIFDSLGEESNARQFEDSFALFVDGKVQAILLPRKGIVIKADGEKLEIKSDCYMPVEQYYGDE